MKAKLGMPDIDWEVRIKDNCACRYCDLSGRGDFNIWMNLGIDHIIPGGGESADNKAVACAECNCLKGTYVPSGSNREERIADARRHIEPKRQAWRQRFETMMDEINLAN